MRCCLETVGIGVGVGVGVGPQLPLVYVPTVISPIPHDSCRSLSYSLSARSVRKELLEIFTTTEGWCFLLMCFTLDLVVPAIASTGNNVLVNIRWYNKSCLPR